MRNELSTWDTEAELAVGRFILEYIEDNPANVEVVDERGKVCGASWVRELLHHRRGAAG